MNFSKICVGIDASNLRRGGGITHISELVSSLDVDSVAIGKVVIWGSAATLSGIPEKPWLHKISLPVFEKSLPARMLWQKYSLSRAAVEQKCDVLFVPGGSFAGSFGPVVTMSQNLLPFEWTEMARYGFSFATLKLFILRFVQARSFKKSDGVIFLTEYAKNSVENVSGKLLAKTDIIPHGINPRFSMSPQERVFPEFFSAANPCRLLYVSIVDAYKHQWSVVDAVYDLRCKGFHVVLELVGPSNPDALKKLNTALAKYKNASDWVIYSGAVSYEELHSKYINADVGLFASTCENLPIILLETMASGLPVACSNKGPMPEVLGSAGVYFDPEKPIEISNAVERYLTSRQLRVDNALASYAMAGNYSWSKCSKRTFDFLVKVARAKSV